MMKYAVNHSWKFEDYKVAFMSGFFQAFMVILVESVNFMAILTTYQIIEIVMNFLALVVIAEFDDFFYAAVQEYDLTDVIDDKMYENFLVVQTTTSIYSRYIMKGNRIKPQPCEEKDYNEKIEEAQELEKNANIDSI